jgi:polyvinyl alcohol dehydrogenase (cytochrome)
VHTTLTSFLLADQTPHFCLIKSECPYQSSVQAFMISGQDQPGAHTMLLTVWTRALSQRGLLVAATLMLACQGDAASDPENDVATLGSMDEQYAWVGDLGDRDALPGKPLYIEHCAGCHEAQVYKAPHTTWLELMSPQVLYRSITEGIMQSQAAHLSDGDKQHIVEYITQMRLGDPNARPDVAWCEGSAAEFTALNETHLTGWGYDTRRYVSPEAAGFDRSEIRNLELKWSFGFPASTRARSQPTIAMGAVFVGSQDGTVYAFDLETGCVRWQFAARAEVRTGITLGKRGPEGIPTAYFGDIIANLYALDATTGELVWQTSPDEHHSATLTGTPAFANGNLYVPVSSLEVVTAANPEYACCTFRGHVMAVNGDDGAVLWDSYAIPDAPISTENTKAGTKIFGPSGAPVWTSPTIDAERNLLIFGTGENYSSPADKNSDAVIAVRLDTGERIWSRQTFPDDAWNVACMMVDNPNCPEEDGPDYDQASSPLLVDIDADTTLVVAGQKDGRVFALDWETGQNKLWEVKLGRGSIQGGVHFGMAASGSTVFVPINDMNDTRNGEWLDPATARPGLSAVDANTGNVLWSRVQENVCGEGRPFCDPGISAAITATDGAVIAGHLDGIIRIYDSQSGDIIWSYNTTTPVTGTNGVTAKGGGMSGSGPAIAAGHMVINSGYGLYNHEAGNALLVFAPRSEGAMSEGQPD